MPKILPKFMLIFFLRFMWVSIFGYVSFSLSQVIRMNLLNMPVGLLYSRLIPLVLLLVEGKYHVSVASSFHYMLNLCLLIEAYYLNLFSLGGSPIDIADPRWEIYFVVKKTRDKSGDYSMKLLGFAAAYLFYHYPDSTRLRISQVSCLIFHDDICIYIFIKSLDYIPENV